MKTIYFLAALMLFTLSVESAKADVVGLLGSAAIGAATGAAGTYVVEKMFDEDGNEVQIPSQAVSPVNVCGAFIAITETDNFYRYGDLRWDTGKHITKLADKLADACMRMWLSEEEEQTDG